MSHWLIGSDDWLLRFVAGDKSVDQDLLPWLLGEFPYLNLSPATLHNLSRKSSTQLDHLSQAEADVRRRKTKAQEQVRFCRDSAVCVPSHSVAVPQSFFSSVLVF